MNTEQQADLDKIYRVFYEGKPYSGFPNKKQISQVFDFIKKIDLVQGKLYQASIKLVWIHGDISNPYWLGCRDEQTNNEIYQTISEPGEVFCYIGCELYSWIDSLDKRKYSTYWAKALVDEHIGYFPILQSLVLEENVNEFKKIIFEANV